MAKFCSNCGASLNDDAGFCNACGAAQGAQQQAQPQYQQPQYQYQQPQYQAQPQYVPVAGPRPGKGLGIAGLVLGILGLIYSFIELIAAFTVMDSRLLSGVADDLMVECIIVFIFPLLATIFGGAARNKGYKTGVSTAGFVMGIIGSAFCLISIIILATI